MSYLSACNSGRDWTGLVGIQGGLGDNEGRIDRDASRSRNTARR